MKKDQPTNYLFTLTMAPQADLEELGPWKRRAPVNDNGEPATISTSTGRKKQKAATAAQSSTKPSDKNGPRTSTNGKKNKFLLPHSQLVKMPHLLF